MAILLPRLQELDRYVTTDEPNWLMRSGNYYMALYQRSLKDTYQHEQPRVTITWAGMLSFLRNYPSYTDVPGLIVRSSARHPSGESASTSANLHFWRD